jgi:glycerophosphoryl diester phosphodiesterase
VLPRISAHDGGAEQARRGTWEAYEHAVTTGAELAELDIRRAGDGSLVVHHDAALPGGPAIAGLSYPDLCAAAGYRVPLAGEVLALLSRHGLAAHLDLKETGYEADVAKLAVAALGEDNVIATTLEDTSVSALKTSFPQMVCALSLGRDLHEVPPRQWARVRASELAPLRRVRRCRADWVAVNWKLARLGVLRACHRAGVGVMVWTVDGDAQLDAFLRDERVSVVITNRPGHAARLRGLMRPG